MSSHRHLQVSVEGGPAQRCGEFVDVLLAVAVCNDGTVVACSTDCLPPAVAAQVLRELADSIVANGLDHIEPRVEP